MIKDDSAAGGEDARERAWKLEQELAQILHRHNEEVSI